MTKLSAIVSKTAPVLGAVLNTVLPGSGMVLAALGNFLGIPMASADDLASYLEKNPAEMVKLKQFELQHLTEIEQIMLKDRESARNREIQLVSAGEKNWVMKFIAVFVVLGFFAMSFIVAFTHLDGTDRDIFFMLVGVLGSKFGSIVDYFYGASRERAPAVVSQQALLDLPAPEQTR